MLPTAPAPADDTTTVEAEPEIEPAAPAPEQEPEQEPEPEAPAPRKKAAKTEMGGMGFPARNGKTLSILSDVPHETIRSVAGIIVPLTNEEYKTKGDAEIIERLKELGKI